MEKSLSIEEKIQRILNTNRLEEVSLECMPTIQTDKYYFVSYSHKDYKQVYKDILNLQERGFSIWYDRGMEAGKSWRETAEKYITKYNCAGVILYMSENSILSGAVHEEIKLLKEHGKDFLTINLPLGDEYMSACEMVLKLKQEGHYVDPLKEEFISRYLNEDIIYVRYDATYSFKSEKIKSLKASPLFNYDEFDVSEKRDTVEDTYQEYIWPYHVSNEKNLIETKAINDLEIKEIYTKDFLNSFDQHDLMENLVRIGDSTFSNCRNLTNIDLPENVSVLGNYAFYNCKKLRHIDLSNILMIKSHAFENCESLLSLDLSHIKGGTSISDFICRNCINLGEVKLPNGLNKIGKCAFENTNLKSVETAYLFGDGIDQFAFYNCKNLKNFNVLGAGDFKIQRKAFVGCDNFTEFNAEACEIEVLEEAFLNCKNIIKFPFLSVKSLGNSSFSGCTSLKELIIHGIEIKPYCFNGCENIENIKFVEKKDYIIGFAAFKNCVKLSCVKFANKLKVINANAFKNCINLTNVYLPNGILEISNKAFLECKQLQKIYFAGSSLEFEEIMKKNSEPWFLETSDYVVICKDRTISKYEFK